MEPECSLPHSQQPATCTYYEPDQSSPCFPIPLLERSILILSSYVRQDPQSISFLLCPHQNPVAPLFSTIRATCPAHFLSTVRPKQLPIQQIPRAPSRGAQTAEHEGFPTSSPWCPRYMIYEHVTSMAKRTPKFRWRSQENLRDIPADTEGEAIAVSAIRYGSGV